MHPVPQSDWTRAAFGIGAAHAVVADRQVQPVVAFLPGDVRV
jgi:hypothetical protein